MGNEATYLPTPEEIYEERTLFTRYIRDFGWPSRVLVSIMVHDMPTMETAIELIERHGGDLALMKIEHILRGGRNVGEV